MHYLIDLSAFDDSEDSEEFREAVSASFLNRTKNAAKTDLIQNTGINYNFLLLTNSEIFDNQLPLSHIIKGCLDFKVNPLEKGHCGVTDIINELLLTLNETRFQELREKDEQSLSSNTRLSSTGPESRKTESAPPPEPQPVSLGKLPGLLHHQIHSLNENTNKDEMVRLLQSIWNAEEDDYHGVFMDAHDIMRNSDLSSISSPDTGEKVTQILMKQNKGLFAAIDEIIDYAAVRRIQIIVRFGDHYTLLDIDKQNKSAVILDASGDFRRLRLRELPHFSQHINAITDIDPVRIQHGSMIKAEHIQKDSSSCPLFSLGMSLASSKHRELHAEVNRVAKKDPKITFLVRATWFDLPPELIKLCQSSTILEQYIRKKPELRERVYLLTRNNTPGHALSRLKADYARLIADLIYKKTDAELVLIIDGTEPNNATLSQRGH